MKRGFTLLEVLLAAIILGLGLTTILVSMSQAQRAMLKSVDFQTVQEVMDLGEMAYPLSEVTDPDEVEVDETKATELWDIVAGGRGPKLSNEQEEKFRGYVWSRELIEKNPSEDDLKRMGNIYPVRVTVKWGDWRRGNSESESYVTFWRKGEE